MQPPDVLNLLPHQSPFLNGITDFQDIRDIIQRECDAVESQYGNLIGWYYDDFSLSL